MFDDKCVFCGKEFVTSDIKYSTVTFFTGIFFLWKLLHYRTDEKKNDDPLKIPAVSVPSMVSVPKISPLTRIFNEVEVREGCEDKRFVEGCVNEKNHRDISILDVIKKTRVLQDIRKIRKMDPSSKKSTNVEWNYLEKME